MRILVTGAGGFLGAAIVRAALADGHDVVATIRRPAARLQDVAKSIRTLTLDLTDHAAIGPALAGIGADVVIHTAWAGLSGLERGDLIQFDQVEICWRLVCAAADAGASKFVGIGSQDEYGPIEGPIDEYVLPRPISAYGAAKHAAAMLAARAADASGIDFAWMRVFALYGTDDSPNWLIPSITRQLREGKVPHTTQGTQRWDYLHVDDAARGVLATVTTPRATGTFNLSSGMPVTVRSVIERLRDLAAPGLELRFGEVPFGPNQIMHMEGVNNRLRSITGWAPRILLDEGLHATVNGIHPKISCASLALLAP